MTARHEILGGLVQLYQRPGSSHWQCSATVGGQQFRKTTKLDELAQAKDFAEDWFLSLKGKHRWGGGVARGKLFREAAEVFLDEFRLLAGADKSPKYIAVLECKIRKYLIPFFGEMVMSEITEADVQRYRIERAKAVDAEGNPKPPSKTSIHHEIQALRHVLHTAKRYGWIKFVPDLRPPYRGKIKVSHRAWFSQDEYNALIKLTRERAQRPEHPKWRWESEQFHDWVLFMANTGLRPGEDAHLQFQDVKVVEDDGETILHIQVRGKRGVGVCKSTPRAVEPFRRLQQRERPRDPETDLPPARRKGLSRGGLKADQQKAKPVPTDLVFGKTQREMMNSVLGKLGLKFDREGQRRSAYSLRHTYICFRLLNGADVYQIAKNCRTSVEIIQKY